MNKTKNFVWFISVVALLALAFVFYKTVTNKNAAKPEESAPIFSDEFVNTSKTFSDGLTNPDSTTQYHLDEFDVGISEKSIYYIDINNDKVKDRITKVLIETGNAHSYYQYKIELNQNGKFVDITPKDFRTVNGSDCDLQQIQFVFKPIFHAILISREMGDTWDTPTTAKKQTFKISDDKMKSDAPKNLRSVCDVKELF